MPDETTVAITAGYYATLVTYIAYTLISIALTVWVARTLHKNGRLFLIDAFHGDEPRADAVNHLLVVGFYLVNIGFILLFLKWGEKPTGVINGIEYAATKLGIVMLVLGMMHFYNMYNFDKMRKKAKRSEFIAQQMKKDIPPTFPNKTSEVITQLNQ